MEPLALTHLPPEDEALREPIRAFLAEHLQPIPLARRARGWMGFDAELSRSLGRAGWIGLTLPAEYGGGGRSYFSRFVVIEELLAAGAPVGAHWIAERQSAPLLLRYGSEEQKKTIIPAICRGDAFFCAGMSEPGTGSDLASVQTKATRVDGGWRISGSKIWTSHAHHADYMIALVRTRPKEAERHSGLSQFLIPMKAPGITVRPIIDLAGDRHFAEVFFDDVGLPDDALIGDEGNGWAQVTSELGFERSGPERIHSATLLIDLWLEHLRSSPVVSDGERELMGSLLVQLSALRSMSIAVTAKLARGEQPSVEAALVKDLGSSFEQAAVALIAGRLAEKGRAGAPTGLLEVLDYMTMMAPTFSLRGGTREILRGIIARGLGLR